jgi:hypothetical protein
MMTTQNEECYAEENISGWSVIDPAGGRWWPSEEAEKEIEAAEDPAARAVMICDSEPARGEWRS